MARECPWYVSAHAVRRWQALSPEAPAELEAAHDALIELCAAIWWERYADARRAPRVTRTGAYLYEGGQAHGRIRLVVTPRPRREGGKAQVVDVVARNENARPK